MRGLPVVLSLVLLLSSCGTSSRSILPTSQYQQRSIEEWTVMIHPLALERDTNVAGTLSTLQTELHALATMLPSAKVQLLKRYRFWIDDGCDIESPITTHYSKDWLVKHQHNPDMAMSIEICHPNQFRWSAADDHGLVLRNLAAAYQAEHLKGDKALFEAYDDAMAQQKYQRVRNAIGREVRSIASADPVGYFAELTSAYFGVASTYPFNRKDLQEYDPAGYQLMVSVWSR